MAVSLVTAFAGKAHITSLDTARFNAGVVGKGDYVFAGVGDNKLKATMASSNKVHIASGNGMMQGHHFVVDAAGVDLTVQTGTQGQKRNDLVVARYTKNSSTGVEAVDLAVIKGTPTTGTPADPAYTKGDILNGTALTADMPLWRIPLNGITVGAPVQMFTEIDSAKDAWDSVSHGIDIRLPDAASPTHKYEYIHLTTWGKLATIQFYASCLYAKPSGSVVQFADQRIPRPLGDVAYCIGGSGAQFFVPVSGGSVGLSTACEVGSADWIKLVYITT